MGTQPTMAGQPVRRLSTGALGITTDEPMKRTPRIAVQWVGGPYPVLMQLEEIELARNLMEVPGA